jgi:hypothetical protein
MHCMRKIKPIHILDADQRAVLDRPASMRAQFIHSYSDQIRPLLPRFIEIRWTSLLTAMAE